jgi:hypothetical protein
VRERKTIGRWWAGTHGEDEAGDKALERRGVEDAAGTLLVPHKSRCKVRLFLGAASSSSQVSRHGAAVVFGSDAEVVHSACNRSGTN